MVDEFDDAPMVRGADLWTAGVPSLEERAVRAVQEIRGAAEVLEPQADAWKQALRDVYSRIVGEQVAATDDAMSRELVDSYRRLYDEMLRLSTMLDPGIARQDPEVPE